MSSKSYQTEGIIIRRFNQGETDKAITIFTKDKGKIKALAKGARKITSKRGCHLELFNRVKVIIYQGKRFDTITGAIALDCFPDIRKSHEITQLAYQVCEITDSLLLEGQKHPEIYTKLVSVLNSCDKEKVREFSINLLQSLGFLPTKEYPKSFNINNFIEGVLERQLKTTVS